jgi:hypothetical protein
MGNAPAAPAGTAVPQDAQNRAPGARGCPQLTQKAAATLGEGEVVSKGVVGDLG